MDYDILIMYHRLRVTDYPILIFHIPKSISFSTQWRDGPKMKDSFSRTSKEYTIKYPDLFPSCYEGPAYHSFEFIL